MASATVRPSTTTWVRQVVPDHISSTVTSVHPVQVVPDHISSTVTSVHTAAAPRAVYRSPSPPGQMPAQPVAVRRVYQSPVGAAWSQPLAGALPGGINPAQPATLLPRQVVTTSIAASSVEPAAAAPVQPGAVAEAKPDAAPDGSPTASERAKPSRRAPQGAPTATAARLAARSCRSLSPPGAASAKGQQRTPNPSRHSIWYDDLYQESIERGNRRRELQELGEEFKERERKQRLAEAQRARSAKRTLFKPKDTRSHMERELEIVRRRKDLNARAEELALAREQAELQECTFHPVTNHSRQRDRSPSSSFAGDQRAAPAAPRRSVSSRSAPRQDVEARSAGTSARRPLAGRRASLPGSPLGSDNDERAAMARLQQIVEQQQGASEALQALAEEQEAAKEELQTQHAELHDEILREETERVVEMLQDVNSNRFVHNEMLQRVRGVIAKGGDSELAQKAIVDELVARSQEEVHRRVSEAFEPVRVEAEGGFHARRLSLVHELELLETQVAALRGGTLCEAARDMGFEFGLAAEAREGLQAPPMQEVAPLQHSTPRAGGHTLPLQQFGESADQPPEAVSPMQDASGHYVARWPGDAGGGDWEDGADAHAEDLEAEAPLSSSKLPADSLLLSFSGCISSARVTSETDTQLVRPDESSNAAEPPALVAPPAVQAVKGSPMTRAVQRCEAHAAVFGVVHAPATSA